MRKYINTPSNPCEILLLIVSTFIDPPFLKRYEEWLKKRNCREATISQLFRTFRSVYNEAIDEKIVKREYYPFHSYKVSKFDLTTQKRSISKDELQVIRTLDLSRNGHD